MIGFYLIFVALICVLVEDAHPGHDLGAEGTGPHLLVVVRVVLVVAQDLQRGVEVVAPLAVEPDHNKIDDQIIYGGDLNTQLVRYSNGYSCLETKWSGNQMLFDYRTSEYQTSKGYSVACYLDPHCSHEIRMHKNENV